MRILIVDDDEVLSEMLRETCVQLGHDPICIHTASECLPRLVEDPPEVVFLDVCLGHSNGLDLIPQIRQKYRNLPLAMMSGFEPLSTASRAIAGGADYFLRKPFGRDEIGTILRGVEQRVPVASSIETPSPQNSGAFIGSSSSMLEACRMMGHSSRTRAVTLIEGESGVGKELAARSIHHLGGEDRPFIVVDCSSLVETLFESTLFGHERGSFTGAVQDRPGRVELAQGGVLFLDEIGELTPRMQSRLLRLLQERTFERVGGDRPIAARFHAVAATNRSLPDMVKTGEFRPDLYFRLSVLHIQLPPLRDRREDIPDLVSHFTRRISGDQGLALPEVTDDAMEVLVSYDWPGNVRELENIVLRTVVRSPQGPLRASSFLEHLGQVSVLPVTRSLSRIEQDAILDALRFCGWDLGKVCSLLEISRPTLRRKMEKYGLNVFNPRKRDN
ncbi:MAG: sigma-54 dependent transcriptional regulator [Planctomycetota bacterium]|nr:sigma-54 dependent transcriptional regulator [Planctomycetota bacterium]